MKRITVSQSKAVLLLLLTAAAVIVYTVQKQNNPDGPETAAVGTATFLRRTVADNVHGLVESVEKDNNPNCMFTVSAEGSGKKCYDRNGNEIPDIMSETVMKSSSRKIIQESAAGEENEIYVSGPGIVINGTKIPDSGFFVQSDLYSDTAEYVICAACFRACGFEKNSDVNMTVYDDAVLRPAHSVMIPVDELEIHTTWQVDHYDRNENTYYLTVTQNGPFSGTSDLFGTYMYGKRFNNMPIRDSCIGSHQVEYDPENRYWTKLDMDRNDLRIRMNRLYYTNYTQLPYRQDAD